MSDEKIKVSLDEVNSTRVDAEVHRQDVASRMAQHQEKIRINFEGSGEMIGVKGGFFRKAMVYMAIFGVVFSFIAWGWGEFIFRNYSKTTSDLERFIIAWLYTITVSAVIALGISIAESIISKNILNAIKNGVTGVILGAIGGAISVFVIGFFYQILGGGDYQHLTFQQVFARAIAWSSLGAFVAIAPGIVMKSWKKFFLGLAGGAIGGFIGGVLFDPICHLCNSDVPARFVNIIGLGIGAAVATVLLENIAKQGWLKVATGIIAGKQFILYRNPTVIGSSPKCEIYLFKDPSVAPKHAAINNRNGDFIVTAIEGATVLLNGNPVKQQTLKTGDLIKIGSTIFLFEAKAMKKQ